MPAIAIMKDGKLHYWTGGEMFNADPDDAVRFARGIDAKSTIPILRTLLGSDLHTSAQVVMIPDEDEDAKRPQRSNAP